MPSILGLVKFSKGFVGCKTDRARDGERQEWRSQTLVQTQITFMPYNSSCCFENGFTLTLRCIVACLHAGLDDIQWKTEAYRHSACHKATDDILDKVLVLWFLSILLFLFLLLLLLLLEWIRIHANAAVRWVLSSKVYQCLHDSFALAVVML